MSRQTQAGRALREKPVRDGILPKADIVSFNLKKWNTCRRMSLAWGGGTSSM